MIPSFVSRQLQRGVADFLEAKISSSTPHFHGVLDEFLSREGTLFKGPYLSLDLPFRTSDIDDEYFPEVPLGFTPYRHQYQAFERLSAPRYDSTLVATGTGSGKTEAFLWPILDHLRRHRDEPGIKAILIYPMNALANDQAGRLKEALGSIPALDDAVAGLYVGGRDERRSRSGPLVTDRAHMRFSPPDILLTNYKMLDYLLTRPRDRPLWQHNTPETLRYLVVDELHTFDGAQGTDLACLIRRLRDRLQTPDGRLCCVGTSATLGGDDAGSELLDYASKVFGTPFSKDAIVGEDRLSPGEFLAEPERGRVPTEAELEGFDASLASDPETLIHAVAPLWLDVGLDDVGAHAARVEIGDRLRKHATVRDLVEFLQGGPRPASAVIAHLVERDDRLEALSDPARRKMLDSLIALISYARSWQVEGRRTRELVDVRVQLWMRELRRMVTRVGTEPRLAFNDDVDASHAAPHLPTVRCQDCGATGWIGARRHGDLILEANAQKVYEAFFNDRPGYACCFPEDGAVDLDADGTHYRLCGHDLALSAPNAAACDVCGRSDDLVDVFIPDLTHTTQDHRTVSSPDCAYCGSRGSLTIFGSQAASLTSVMISQLFASSLNEDKKLITFSDSVQDAAHRAGFFEARTYRFNLRTAIQHCVDDAGALSLADLTKAVGERWRERLGDDDFAGTFIAPDMQWLRDYDQLAQNGTLPESSRLADDIERRIEWEVLREYGYRARIGRTLEKAGASIATLGEALVQAAAGAVIPHLRNQIGGLEGVTRDQVQAFVLDVMMRLKNGGGILHPVLGSYIDAGGNWYPVGSLPFMPRYGRNRRLPAFPARKGTSRFPALLSSSRGGLRPCAIKHFGERSALLEGALPQFFDIVLGALTQVGLLKKEDSRRADAIWGIPMDALRMETEVSQLQCATCGHRLSVATRDAAAWKGMPCHRTSCRGSYDTVAADDAYYRALYRRGTVARIVASEHTGLLERKRREQLEADFKRDDARPWHPNVLSCTPTLEMGVDIGALSSAILCSVPPRPANFIQRVGRAGRKSGNALDVTVANGLPHDLYFFEEPLEMIAGAVEPPGVFLEAVAVLFRQFAAYTLDRWVAEENVPAGGVPNNLAGVLKRLGDESAFPQSWLAYVARNEDRLCDDFGALFHRHVRPTRRAALFHVIRGNGPHPGLERRVVAAFDRIQRRRKRLRRRRRRLNKEVSDLQSGPGPVSEAQRKRLRDLQRDDKMLKRRYASIGDADVFGFLTNSGLLPNYAFPEEGVTLTAVHYRYQDDVPEVWTEEFKRGAGAALRDLAPGNTFYALGHRMVVDQIEIDNEEAFERWRLCPECSHMAPEEEALETDTCPLCDSEHWVDGGQTRVLLRHEHVVSTERARESRIDDSSDNRAVTFYDTELFIEVPRDAIEHAYRSADGSGFGYEYAREIALRELNFGRSGPQPVLLVGGHEVHGQGFELCGDCGRVAASSGEIDHTNDCSVVRKDTEEPREEAYLYRQMGSEALRIVLKEALKDATPRSLHSFQAALRLGLREVFSGSVDHLRTSVQEAPDPEQEIRRRYLVLWDAVPGGTGYLDELGRKPDKMMQVFEAALERLERCSCRHDDHRDGCYQCVYAYREARHMELISRRRAIALLRNVLAYRDEMEEVETVEDIDLEDVPESVLEEYFLMALAELKVYPHRFESKPVNGKKGYLLEVGGEAYEIEPHVDLGRKEGISRPLSVDFLIRSTTDPTRKPVAVFTDGWQYHRDRVDADLAQRRALIASGRYHVWTLTWDDVMRARSADHTAEPVDDMLTLEASPLAKILSRLGDERSGVARTRVKQTPFDWLIDFLQAPEVGAWERLAYAQALLAVRNGRGAVNTERMRSVLPEELVEEVADTICEGELAGQVDSAGQTLWSGLPPAMARTATTDFELARDALHVVLHAPLNEQEREVRQARWRGLWRAFDLFQFLPNFHALVPGSAFDTYDDLLAGIDYLAHDTVPAGPDDDWHEVLAYAIDEWVPLLERLKREGVEAPDVPVYELTDAKGAVTGQIEVAWPGRRIGLASRGDVEAGLEPFEAEGWTIWSEADALHLPGELLADLLEAGKRDQSPRARLAAT